MPFRSEGTSRAMLVDTLAVLAVASGLAWLLWPRHIDPTHFDPEAMAAHETRMWRHYYEGRYLCLLGDLYSLTRKQFGFSPADCLRLSFHAARAAQRFRVSRSRAEAEAVVPGLRSYYALIAARSGCGLDPRSAARLELEWWQQRREGASAEDIARTMALLAAMVYRVPAEDLLPMARCRTGAMAYRDARRDGRMTDADWRHVRDALERAYAEALRVLSGPPSE
ncbi:MAG: hypothetical protein JXR77_00265 [Lentisphaeria bacterium]|nr:hypothetical protein [Lentisphaeria bacterium]